MVSLHSRANRQVVWIVAMIAPMAAVQAVRLIDGSGPAAAPAAPVEPDPAAAIVEPAHRPLTDSQRRALAYLATYTPSPGIASPLDRDDPPPPNPISPATPVSEPNPTPAPALDPLAGLTVTAIIGRGESASAIIGHQLRRLGDEVAPGWHVQSIDPRNRSVKVADDSGNSVVLSPPAR